MYKIISIDKRKVEGMINTIKYECVVYIENRKVDYFTLLQSGSDFWAWTADTINQERVLSREEIVEKLNSGEIVLSGTI